MRRWIPHESDLVGGWLFISKVFGLKKQRLTDDTGRVYAVEESWDNRLTFECSTAEHRFEIWQGELTGKAAFLADHPPCHCAQPNPDLNRKHVASTTSLGLPVTFYIDREIVDWLRQQAKAKCVPLSRVAEETLLAGISALS